jgi:prevent-host-death family protein
MHTLPFTEARAHLADTLREVEATDTPVLISRRGQTAGVLMSWAQYRRLQTGTAGFSARLTQWRAECLAPEAGTGLEEEPDPFADLRDPGPGRVVDWTDAL